MRWLITRPRGQAVEGQRGIFLPLIEILPPRDGGAALRRALRRLKTFDWIVFTSANGVRAVRRICRRFPKKLKIAAAGPQTAAALRGGRHKVYLPEKGEGAGALRAFFRRQKAAGQKILYPRSSIARPELVRGLKKMGAKVTDVEAYQTRPARVSPERLKGILKKVDGVLFYSPSAVESFFSRISPQDPMLKKTRLAARGLTTRKVLESFRNDLHRPLSR